MEKILKRKVHEVLGQGYFVRAAFDTRDGRTTVSKDHYEAWRPMPQPVTEDQQALYEYIKAYIREHDKAPTYREMTDAMGVASTQTISRWVEALVGVGLISVAYHQHRGIALNSIQGDDQAVNG